MDLIEDYLERKTKRLSKRSIIEYRRDLSYLEEWFNKRNTELKTVSSKELSKYIELVGVGNKATNRKLSVFRSFYSFLKNEEVIKDNPTEKI